MLSTALPNQLMKQIEGCLNVKAMTFMVKSKA